MIVGRGRDADTAGFCNALKPRRDVDTVAKNIMRLDNYVADIDAHAESNALVFQIADRKVVDAGLELHSSPNCFDCARKLHQEPVPGVLDNPATVLGDCPGDSVREERRQLGMRGLFIVVH
jgi:hypothetical protein